MREAGCGVARLRDARVGVGRLWDFCSDPRDCKERVGDRREDGRSGMRRRAAAGCERGVAAWKERRSRDARGGEDGRSGGAGGCMEGAEERLRGWKERGGCGAARRGGTAAGVRGLRDAAEAERAPSEVGHLHSIHN
jgi:hypothetical protein